MQDENAKQDKNTSAQDFITFLFHVFQHWLERFHDLEKYNVPPHTSRIDMHIAFPRRLLEIYIALGLWTYILWPTSKDISAPFYVGLLSFEGLVATLLLALAPGAIHSALEKAMQGLWAAIDPTLLRSRHGNPVLLEDLYRGPLLIALLSLASITIMPILSMKLRAVLLVLSVLWTLTFEFRIIMIFVFSDVTDKLGVLYWDIHLMHEQAPHCKQCIDGRPQSPSWPARPADIIKYPDEHVDLVWPDDTRVQPMPKGINSTVRPAPPRASRQRSLWRRSPRRRDQGAGRSRRTYLRAITTPCYVFPSQGSMRIGSGNQRGEPCRRKHLGHSEPPERTASRPRCPPRSDQGVCQHSVPRRTDQGRGQQADLVGH